jgi:hypothetical protein
MLVSPELFTTPVYPNPRAHMLKAIAIHLAAWVADIRRGPNSDCRGDELVASARTKAPLNAPPAQAVSAQEIPGENIAAFPTLMI